MYVTSVQVWHEEMIELPVEPYPLTIEELLDHIEDTETWLFSIDDTEMREDALRYLIAPPEERDQIREELSQKPGYKRASEIVRKIEEETARKIASDIDNK